MEIGVYKISGVMDTSGVTKGVQKFGDEMTRVSKFVERTKKDMKGLYELAPIRNTNYSAFEQEVRNVQAAQIRAMRNSANAENVQAEVQRRLFGGPNIVNEAEVAGKVVGDSVSKGFIAELNGIAGRRSAFGQFFKLFTATGALGGLGLAAREFDNLTKKAEDFALAVDKGPDAMRSATAELLKSIPIVGKLGEGFARIWDIASGTANEVARIEQSTKNIEAVTGFRERSGGSIADAAKDAADFAHHEVQAPALLGKTGIAAEVTRITQEQDNKTREADEKRMADLKARKDDAAKTLNDLNQQLSSIVVPELSTVPVGGDSDMGGGGLSNQGDIDSAIARRKTLEDQIAQIKRDEAKNEAAINDAANQKTAESQRTSIADQVRVAKDAWGKFSEFAVKAYDTVAEGVGKRLQEETDKANKLIEASQAKAASIIEAGKSKLDKLRDRLAEIQALFSGGFLSGDQAQKAINQSGSEFQSRVKFDIPDADRVHGFGVSAGFFQNPQDSRAESLLDATRKACEKTANAVTGVKSVGVFRLN